MDGAVKAADSATDDLGAFVEFMRDTASQAIKYEKLADSDRQELERAEKRLGPAFHELMKLINAQPNQTLRELYAVHLHDALGSAFVVGACGSVPQSADPYLQSQRNSKAGQRERPKAKSPFTDWIIRSKRRNPSITNTEIAEAMERNARNGLDGEFEFDGARDEIVAEAETDNEKRLKLSSLPSTISKALKKFSGSN